MKDTNSSASKKRKRPIKDKGPRKKKKHEETEIEALSKQLFKKHEERVGYCQKASQHAKHISNLINEKIDKLDKKLFDVTREIRRTVNNGEYRLRKPITYQVLDSVFQSEVRIAKAKQKYEEYNVLEKEDVIIHLRSLGRGQEPEVALWEKKVKRNSKVFLDSSEMSLGQS